MFSKILRLEFKNYFKSMLLLLIILNVVIGYIVKNLTQLMTFIKNKPSVCLLYTLFVLIAIAYSGTFITTINFEKEKNSNIYHRYFVLPLNSTAMFIIKLAPALFVNLLIVIVWGIFIWVKTQVVGLGFFFFLLLTSAIFSIGCLLIIYYVNLTIKNTAIVSGVKLSLIFLFSYLPQLVISYNLSIPATKICLIVFSWAVFFVGIVLIRRINSEKIILQ
uniref:ABC transporter permease n=1 Tax=Caldicellulosiruptor owensensis TaxID=55205 RepID=A0A7C5V298_9FIRM